ncbi:Aldose 1-epimerase [uncultured Alphaproteobacteria bacterium]|uniref:Aldose 1-epimerase n=1 Tax=uncultured Alphaproteobacteria bacterium TaxID=91750 RepID=A0A212KKJ6_9PROT|nr:Aldose 1-epimerase [uncultured Alphaproteobacteria bacterium]
MMAVSELSPYLAVRAAFDAPWPGPRGPRIVLRNADLAVTIHPEDGCRMTSLTAFGFELLRPWMPQRRAFQYGCFPMIPWVGRMAGGRLRCGGADYRLPVNKPPHALHGMACFGPWRIVETSPEAAECAVDLGDPWPWPGVATQRFELRSDTLTISLSVAAERDSFPAAAGWHPWFRKWLGDDAGPAAEKLAVAFSADWQEEPGDDELPTGRRIAPRPGPWDDCFGFVGPMSARLVWPDRLRLDMSSPAHAMVVYDKQPDAACVEPLSGPPNGVNTQPFPVSPGAPLVVTTRWKIARLGG